MKKLCLLLSIIMVIVLGTTAFAAGTTDAAIVLTPNNSTIAIDENVVITVGVTGDGANQALYGTGKIVVTWDEEYFEYVEGEVDSTTFALTNATGYAINGNKATYTQKVLATEERPVGPQTYGTLTLKAIKAGSSSITLATGTKVQVNAGTTVAGAATMDATATVAMTITGGAPVANEINKLDTSIEGMDEIVSAFAGKYYVVGSAVALDAATAVENLYLYAQINNAGEKHYAEKSIGSLLKASGAGVVGSVVPVLVVADADAAALNYTFNADAKN